MDYYFLCMLSILMSLFYFWFLFWQYNSGTLCCRLAAEKDSELARASIALGLFLFSRGLLTEASEHFENAISKVLSFRVVNCSPLDDRKVDLVF